MLVGLGSSDMTRCTHWMTKYLIMLLLMEYANTDSIGICTECYMQHCLNCKSVSSACTTSELVGIPVLWETCKTRCLSIAACNVDVYTPSIDGCYPYSCTQVEEDVEGLGYHTMRKICQNSDCLNHNITTKTGHIGICPTLETHTAVASVSHCLTLCLDLEKCRGATYRTNGSCLLHECENVTLDSNDVTFVGRICLDESTQMLGFTVSTPHVAIKPSTCSRTILEESTTIVTTPAFTEDNLTSSTPLASISRRKSTTTFDAVTTTLVPFFTILTKHLQATSNVTLPLTLSLNSTTTPSHSLSITSAVTAHVDTQCTCNDRNYFLDDPINISVIVSAGGIVAVTAVGVGVYTKYLKQGQSP